VNQTIHQGLVQKLTEHPSTMRFVHLLVLTTAAPAASLHIAITGSSQGIGLDAAKRMVAEGHTVYHACRSTERAAVAAAGAGGGVPMVCDLADLDSVRSFAETLRATAPQLDVLCCNAGVSPSTKATVAERTAQGFEVTVGTNHIGHFALAALLEPELAKTKGLVVITASSVHDPEQPGGAVGGKVQRCGPLTPSMVIEWHDPRQSWDGLRSGVCSDWVLIAPTRCEWGGLHFLKVPWAHTQLASEFPILKETQSKLAEIPEQAEFRIGKSFIGAVHVYTARFQGWVNPLFKCIICVYVCMYVCTYLY